MKNAVQSVDATQTAEGTERDELVPAGAVTSGAVTSGAGSRWSQVRATGEAGLATAEYAVATVAAVGFAGLLIAVLKSGEVRELLMGIVRGALSVG